MTSAASSRLSTPRRILVVGGGDVGSAVACELFRQGMQVLIAERPVSSHARRGMAFTDALFDGRSTLEGVLALRVADVAAVLDCWSSAAAIPIATLPEAELAAAIAFEAIVEATMRRWSDTPDLRLMTAELTIGLGPGYAPGINCHIAIETQWGADMGRVLRDQPAAERSGGPRALAGVTRERFVSAPSTGVWRTAADLGQPVRAGDQIGSIAARPIHAPIDGFLRGVARDGIQVREGQCVLEVDPRATPEITGMGERPRAIARGVAQALATP
jgi:xanthine dehydrogenase accessory factor